MISVSQAFLSSRPPLLRRLIHCCFSGRNDDAYDDYDEEDPGQGNRNNPENDGRGKFTESVHVPDRYLARICGSQHTRRKEWENLTHTTIEIPKKGSSGDVGEFSAASSCIPESMVESPNAEFLISLQSFPGMTRLTFSSASKRYRI